MFSFYEISNLLYAINNSLFTFFILRKNHFIYFINLLKVYIYNYILKFTKFTNYIFVSYFIHMYRRIFKLVFFENIEDICVINQKNYK